VSLFNGLAQAQILSTLVDGQRVSNTFYLSHAGAGAPPDLPALTQLGTDLNAWLGTQYIGVLPTNATFDSITVRQVANPTSPTIVLESTHLNGSNGTRAVASGDATPKSLCALIKLRTPNASRNFRGHLFMPPIQISVGLAGNVFIAGSAYISAIDALVTKLAAGALASPTWTGTELSNYGLVIYSKTLALRALPSVALCNQVAHDLRVRWLRSRERGTT
jgi:hypothetical protein